MILLQFKHPQLKNRYWQASRGFIFPVLPSLSLWLSFPAKSQAPQLDEIKWLYWEALNLAWFSMFSSWGHSLSREWRLFSLSLMQLLGIKSGAVCSEASPAPALTLPSLNPPNPDTTTPPCTTAKDNPTPSMAHYRVAFHFFLIILFLCSSKVEDKLFNKSPGVNFMRT